MSLFCAPVRAGAGRFGVFPLGVRLSGVAVLVRANGGASTGSRGATTGNSGAIVP